jgi:hypothetical protein
MLGPKVLHIFLTLSTEILEKIVGGADKKGYRAIVITCDNSSGRVRDQRKLLLNEASKYIDPEITQYTVMPN